MERRKKVESQENEIIYREMEQSRDEMRRKHQDMEDKIQAASEERDAIDKKLKANREEIERLQDDREEMERKE